MSDGIIQPALIIGTGGSGIEVLRRFKRRFREIYPDTPYVQLLGIDTAPQEQLGRDAPELSQDEFLYASGFNMDFFVGPEFIDRHPAIRAWWRGYDNLKMRAIKAGAGQKRPVGRLALFVKREEVVARVKEQVQRIFNSKVFGELPREYRRSINLYVVSSTCGGTGTGQFIDLAYIAQRTIRDVRPGISVSSRGLFFLPSAFLETQQVAPQNGPRLQANAFGALTELDYLMHPDVDPGDVAYDHNFTVSRKDRPFRSVYLVGNQTADGRLYTDFHEIVERCSVHVMIELASPLTNTGNARMDNVLAAVDAKGPISGRGRSYSSFGEEWMELPTARLRARWQKRLGVRILDRLMGEDSDQASVNPLDDSGAFGRLRALRTSQGLAAYWPRVDTERSIFTDIGQDGLETPEILANANALEAAATRQLASVEPEVKKAVREASGGAAEEIGRAAKQIIAEGRIGDLLSLCASAEEDLRKWVAEARRTASYQGDATWVRDLGGQLGQIKPGLIGGKKRAADAQRSVVLEAEGNAAEAWRGRLNAAVGAAMQTELPALLHKIHLLRDTAQQVATYLAAARTMVSQREEPVTPAGVDTGALTDADIDVAFEEGNRPERLEREAGRILQELLALPRITVEAVEEAVWKATGSAVTKLSDEFLRNVSIPAAEVAERLGQLQPLAVYEPAWSANPARAHVERLRILGLHHNSMDRQSEILDQLPADIRSETECVEHADPDRVVMTVQDHGFPLFALDEASDLKAVFDQLSPGEQNLCFVLPEAAARNWSFKPEGASESKKYYGLAFVLQMIRQVGPRLVFNAGGNGAVDATLGEGADIASGLQAALDQFLSDGYATSVKTAIRGAEEADTAALHLKCRTWVDDQRQRQMQSGYPTVMMEIVDRVEEYTNSIKPF